MTCQSDFDDAVYQVISISRTDQEISEIHDWTDWQKCCTHYKTPKRAKAAIQDGTCNKSQIQDQSEKWHNMYKVISFQGNTTCIQISNE